MIKRETNLDLQEQEKAEIERRHRLCNSVPDVSSVWMPLDALKPWDKNPRKNDGVPVERVAESIRHFGFVAPIVVWRAEGRMVAGHTRLKAMRHIMAQDPSFVAKGAPGPGLVRVVFHGFANEHEADLFALADNKLGELADWDDDAVAAMLASYDQDEQSLAGFADEADISELGDASGSSDGDEKPDPEVARATLAQRFGVPPFSVLEARQGYWQDRKRAWLALGIRSEIGRGAQTEDVNVERESLTKRPNAMPGGSPMPLDRLKNARRAKRHLGAV